MESFDSREHRKNEKTPDRERHLLRDLDKTMDDYLAGRLAEQDMQAFEEYYFDNEDAFQELQTRQAMSQVVKQKGKSLLAHSLLSSKSQKLSQRLNNWMSELKAFFTNRWIPVTAGIAAIALLVILGHNLTNRQNLIEQRAMFAANSDPSPLLESLLNQSQRAGNVTVVSPDNGLNVQKDVLFEWQSDETLELFIIILNNREEELFTFSTTGNKYLFENAVDHLAPGLYYWKLEDAEDIRYVGKFFVKKPAD